ncbi:hypothetical protein C6496_20790 [Candidatus Poribacteria bacterium]|nr:MAG: hypothetical protein C6496_20790 [Candidatus Poribacteria bacterium]
MNKLRLLPLILATGFLASTVGAQQGEVIVPHLLFHFGVSQPPPGDRMLPRVSRHIVFNLDDTKIISKLEDGSVVQWDLATREEKYITTTQDLFAYSPVQNLLLVRTKNDDVTLIPLDTNQEVVLTNGAFENGSLSTNGKFVALSRGDKQIEIWEIDQKRLLKRLKAVEPVRNGLTISHDGQYVAAAEGTYRDGEGHRTNIEVWDLKQDTPADLIDTGIILGVWNLHFSPDGSMLAVDSQIEAKAGIRVWERSTREQLCLIDNLEAYWARALTFALDGKYIALGDESGVLMLSDIKEDREVFALRADTGIESLAFSHDGKYMAVGLFDSTVQIWELKSDL